MKVYKAGRKLPAEDGITSLLANPQWSATFYRSKPTTSQTMHVCSRVTPFFVCATLEAAIAEGTMPPGRLPEGVVVEVWDAEAPEVFPPLPWVPHPDHATPEWFDFWHSSIDYDGRFLAPDLAGCHFHRVQCSEQTRLCFELTLLAPVCVVPPLPQAVQP